MKEYDETKYKLVPIEEADTDPEKEPGPVGSLVTIVLVVIAILLLLLFIYWIFLNIHWLLSFLPLENPP
jgi:hypothetical protein